MTPEIDIVIPVYNEGRQIVAVLAGLARAVKTPARVLICYDHTEDDTLPALRANPQAYAGWAVEHMRATSLAIGRPSWVTSASAPILRFFQSSGSSDT
jgi:hypothetical protein